MLLTDSVEYATKSLRTRSLRSWLTIIGIVIGVIAMVVITAVTEGVNKEVTDLLSSFTPDKMFVIPINIDGEGGLSSFGGGPVQSTTGKLYQRDVDSIESVPGVEATSRMVYGRASLDFKDKQITATLYAADENIFEMFGGY